MKNDNIIYDIIHELDVEEDDKELIIEDLNNDTDYLEELIRFVYQQGLEKGWLKENGQETLTFPDGFCIKLESTSHFYSNRNQQLTFTYITQNQNI